MNVFKACGGAALVGNFGAFITQAGDWEHHRLTLSKHKDTVVLLFLLHPHWVEQMRHEAHHIYWVFNANDAVDDLLNLFTTRWI